MKKLLEKPWAKALAFLLTLLPGTAAVYGGVELVYICVYNMHTDRRLDMLWAVTAVCAVAAAAALALFIALVPGRLGQFLRFGLQQLVEGFLYASAHKFLELPLDNFFV